MQAALPPSRKPRSPFSEGLAEAGGQSTPESLPLPPEIGFLAEHGLRPESLRWAAERAAAAGVPPDAFLLKGGFVDETTFYRALARELGLRFTARPRLSRHCRFPDSILTGIAPLATGGHFAIAPHGPILARLLQGRRALDPGLVVTAPNLLTQAILRSQGAAIADRGANLLSDRAPALSARDGPTVGQIAGLCAFTLLASFGGTRAPHLAASCLAAGLSPLFFAAVVLRISASLLSHPVLRTVPRPRIADRDLPVYTVIVPLYRERRIARRLVAALARLDYPAAKLDIKLVLEADDADTLRTLAALPLPGFVALIAAPPGMPRTKPRALNIALPLAKGLYTVIYDAEDVPEPGQLREAVAAFATLPPHVACLQARLTIDNTDDSWLTRLFTIEYAALFDVLNPGLAEIGSPVLLGGTSNHFRTQVLRELGGWDAWNVTEDADLGLRLARFGYRTADLPSSTLEEAPGTLTAWMRQRTRWMKGFMQTCTSHSRRPWRTCAQLGAWRSIGALALTFGTVLSALGYPFFMLMIFATWRHAVPRLAAPVWQGAWQAWSNTLFGLGLAAVFIPACVALHRRRLWRLWPWTLLLPVYYALVSLAAWRALWEVTRDPFRWNKTSHGLARTSRAGLVRSSRRGPPTPYR